MDKHNITSQNYSEYLDYSRRTLLNILEASYGHTEAWPFIRSRVLQLFGQNGLSRFSCNPNKEKINGVKEETKNNR